MDLKTIISTVGAGAIGWYLTKNADNKIRNAVLTGGATYAGIKFLHIDTRSNLIPIQESTGPNETKENSTSPDMRVDVPTPFVDANSGAGAGSRSGSGSGMIIGGNSGGSFIPNPPSLITNPNGYEDSKGNFILSQPPIPEPDRLANMLFYGGDQPSRFDMPLPQGRATAEQIRASVPPVYGESLLSRTLAPDPSNPSGIYTRVGQKAEPIRLPELGF
jgi:hypothetical protein